VVQLKDNDWCGFIAANIDFDDWPEKLYATQFANNGPMGSRT
jgi:hypothetical protein